MKTKEPTIITQEGKTFDIPEGGTLGLLAAGYKGIMVWRHRRKEIIAERTKNQTPDEKK